MESPELARRFEEVSQRSGKHEKLTLAETHDFKRQDLCREFFGDDYEHHLYRDKNSGVISKISRLQPDANLCHEPDSVHFRDAHLTPGSECRKRHFTAVATVLKFFHAETRYSLLVRLHQNDEQDSIKTVDRFSATDGTGKAFRVQLSRGGGEKMVYVRGEPVEAVLKRIKAAKDLKITPIGVIAKQPPFSPGTRSHRLIAGKIQPCPELTSETKLECEKLFIDDSYKTYSDELKALLAEGKYSAGDSVTAPAGERNHYAFCKAAFAAIGAAQNWPANLVASQSDKLIARVNQDIAATESKKEWNEIVLTKLKDALHQLGYNGLILHQPDASMVLASGDSTVHLIQKPADHKSLVSFHPLLPKP